ncbi:hypothetical protein PISL3812_07031 [Talaromyces islandicus]|uniref:Enoyl reductase (ER) domain-containing protein n=1 Tax=Talaromyces islandicus TaxID=28573 RepID=A0A0U1M4P3_TALIS|nr:hypothetical protein PISL3812_07031 [Talaromyces islandicus]
MSIPNKAIVAYGPYRTGQWKLRDVVPRSLEEKELLVEIVASGICHSDLHFGDAESGFGVHYPRVMGHEGVGYVRQLGPNTSVAQIGDPVILTFSACHSCEPCEAGHSAHCRQFASLNFGVSGATYNFGDSDQQQKIYGSFFGQSSFSSLTVVRESSVVNVSRMLGQNKDELALMAPLGCGVQTGTGAIIHAANAGPKDRVVIIGLGGVGLSAVMGAKIAGCAQIIGIDRYESRLDLARELGATDVINTASMSSMGQMSDMVLANTNNLGANITLDATGVQELIQESIKMTAFKGKILQVGAAPMDANLKIPIFEFMSDGKQYMGVVEGDVDPRRYIPKMIEWVRDGRLPLQKIVRFYDAEDYETAINDMKSGKVIKPIIRW